MPHMSAGLFKVAVYSRVATSSSGKIVPKFFKDISRTPLSGNGSESHILTTPYTFTNIVPDRSGNFTRNKTHIEQLASFLYDKAIALGKVSLCSSFLDNINSYDIISGEKTLKTINDFDGREIYFLLSEANVCEIEVLKGAQISNIQDLLKILFTKSTSALVRWLNTNKFGELVDLSELNR